jgi:hypothetical protein
MLFGFGWQAFSRSLTTIKMIRLSTWKVADFGSFWATWV